MLLVCDKCYHTQLSVHKDILSNSRSVLEIRDVKWLITTTAISTLHTVVMVASHSGCLANYNSKQYPPKKSCKPGLMQLSSTEK